MESMRNYTQYCTEEQTRRAYALGAPIETSKESYPCYGCELKFNNKGECFLYGEHPTTQQMIWWLREKCIGVIIYKCNIYSYGFRVVNNNYSDCRIAGNTIFDTYEEAELAAIDAALDYLGEGGTL